LARVADPRLASGSNTTAQALATQAEHFLAAARFSLGPVTSRWATHSTPRTGFLEVNEYTGRDREEAAHP